MKNQRGITLIALVITIIVLLILAGVSIAMLTGKNGILTRASGASQTSIWGEVDEAVKLGVAEIVTNQMDPTFNNTAATTAGAVTVEVTADNVAKAITQNNANLTAKVNGSPIPAKDGGNIEVTVASDTAGVKVTWTDKKGTAYEWKIDSEGKVTPPTTKPTE